MEQPGILYGQLAGHAHQMILGLSESDKASALEKYIEQDRGASNNQQHQDGSQYGGVTAQAAVQRVSEQEDERCRYHQRSDLHEPAQRQGMYHALIVTRESFREVLRRQNKFEGGSHGWRLAIR